MDKTLKLNVPLVGGIFVLLLAVVAYIAIPYTITNIKPDVAVGPDTFPRMVSILCGIFGLLQIIMVIIGKKPSQYREYSLRSHGKVIIAITMAIITIILSNIVNVIFPATVCSLLYLVLLRAKDWRYYVAVVVSSGLLYLLMRFALNIRF